LANEEKINALIKDATIRAIARIKRVLDDLR
jgi:hypothetical protein